MKGKGIPNCYYDRCLEWKSMINLILHVKLYTENKQLIYDWRPDAQEICARVPAFTTPALSGRSSGKWFSHLV